MPLTKDDKCEFCGAGTKIHPSFQTHDEEPFYVFDCECSNFASMEPVTCWVPCCETTIYPWLALPDPPYGHHCPLCNESLRSHPVLGEGKKNDLAKKAADALRVKDLSSVELNVNAA